MNFILKPKKEMHGRSLKKWYRRVNIALVGYQHLPISWALHPTVVVPADKLPTVMSNLYKANIF